MRSFPKQLAASAVLLGLLAAGAALPATAASPLSAAAAITMPWATPSDVTDTMLGLSETKLTLARLAAFSGRMSGESCWAVPTVMVAA